MIKMKILIIIKSVLLLRWKFYTVLSSCLTKISVPQVLVAPDSFPSRTVTGTTTASRVPPAKVPWLAEVSSQMEKTSSVPTAPKQS